MMKSLPPMLLVVLFVFFIYSVAVVAATNNGNDVVFRWASCGGGWRAMVTNMGFANAMNRVGVSFDNTASNNNHGSQPPPPTITGMSSTSGATWFSTQFFYSEEFYNAVLKDDGEALSELVVSWMDSYLKMTEEILLSDKSDCKFPVPAFGFPYSWCIMLRYFKGDWAAFVSDMLWRANNSYEKGADNATRIPFPNRTAGSGNRNLALQNTDMIVQASLAPMSRKSYEGFGEVYLGPSSDGSSNNSNNDLHFSTFLPTAYTVTSASGTQFHIGNWSSNDMTTYSSEANSTGSFSMSQYDEYYLYDGEGRASIADSEESPSLFVSSSSVTNNTHFVSSTTSTLAVPFSTSGDTPNLGQIASISSAVLGTLSGLNPSVMAQQASKPLYQIENNPNLSTEQKILGKKAFSGGLDVLYNLQGIWGASVCSQWPNECGNADSRFSDGLYTDEPSLLMNVAQYQRDNSNQSPPPLLKFVLLNPNGVSPTTNYFSVNQDSLIMGYFNTTYNIGIDPGEYIWAPGLLTPNPSTQFLDEFLGHDEFHSKFEPIEGTNWTTAILKGTTIDNPVYGVQAGQNIEMFYFMINSPIDTVIMGTEAIKTQTQPLADLALQIATNKILQDRIKAFFFDGNNLVIPTTKNATKDPTRIGTPPSQLDVPATNPTLAKSSATVTITEGWTSCATPSIVATVFIAALLGMN